MQLTRKALLSIDLTQQDVGETLKTVRSMEFLQHAEVHLVFVFQTVSMNLGFGEFPYVYPIPKDQNSILQSIESTLHGLAAKAFGAEQKGKLVARCLFGEDTKDTMCEYIKEKNIDLVVLWAREKRGIFESSFSSFVSKHTRANVLLVKTRAD